MTGYALFNSYGILPCDGYQLLKMIEALKSRNIKLKKNEGFNM